MPLPQFSAVKIPNATNVAFPNPSNLRLTRPSSVPDILTAYLPTKMSASGRFRSVRFPNEYRSTPPPPLLPPPLLYAQFLPVRFRYALSSPLQAGPFYVRKRRIEFWSICSPSPAEVLTQEDHTAPIQTAPLQLHSEGGTLNGLRYAKRGQVHSGVAKHLFVAQSRLRPGFSCR